MITASDLYSVLAAVFPLYFTMLLAYFSVKWWKIFTPDQCAGINRFVAIFAIPFLSLEFISRINPYKMDLLFIAADVVSKVLTLFVLFTWAKFSKRGSLDWAITLFSLLTLPNTLVMGIPLLKAMYGNDKENLMIQAVVLQITLWYNLLLLLFEYREARIMILHKFNGSHNGDTDISGESEGRAPMIGGGSFGREEEIVHVVVTRPSNSGFSDSDPQTAENLNKVASDSRSLKPMVAAAMEEDGKELHLFIWRCGCCISEGVCEQSVQVFQREEENSIKGKAAKDETPVAPKVIEKPSFSSFQILRMILKMVWFKLIKNPNSYANLLGLSWALASCRLGFKKPQIIENSVTILSNAGLGMAMFSLGLFMALQPKIIACGKKMAAYGMLLRFVAGPAIMAVASILVGLRGTILKVSIVQAALPQGIVTFVFAREYNLHPDVLSTAVIFGMIVSLPFTILYYIFLGL